MLEGRVEERGGFTCYISGVRLNINVVRVGHYMVSYRVQRRKKASVSSNFRVEFEIM